MKTTTRIAAAVAGAALSFGTLTTVASAAPADPKPACAQQTAQVAKAEGALERLTKVFERQSLTVKKAKKAVAKADNPGQKRKAKKALVNARDKKATTAKAKKAQQQRLVKAQQRLATCTAAQPTAAA